MENIIIPVISEEMISFANDTLKRKGSRVVIGVTKSLVAQIKTPTSYDGCIKQFEDGTTKEEIINSLNSELDDGKVLICRKAITEGEISSFFASNSDITVCAEKRNKFKNFLFKMWQYFVRVLFGFEFFDGDISVVCFKENLFPVISNLSNLSYASRVNKWKYVTVSQVETSEPAVEKEYSKTRSVATVCMWVFLLMAVIVTTIIFFMYFTPKFLTCLLFACSILLAIVGLLISIAVHTLNVRTGRRNFKKGKIVK